MKATNLWVDRPGIDWVVCVVVCTVAWYSDSLGLLPNNDKATLYQTLVSFAMAVLSLGAVTVTFIVTGAPSENLKTAMRESGRGLVALIFSCLFGCLISAFVYTSLYFVPSVDTTVAGTLFVFASVLLALRSIRLIWLLRSILNLLV